MDLVDGRLTLEKLLGRSELVRPEPLALTVLR
jgi:hypothetical protein